MALEIRIESAGFHAQDSAQVSALAMQCNANPVVLHDRVQVNPSEGIGLPVQPQLGPVGVCNAAGEEVPRRSGPQGFR
jgi:hypothetical protein